MLISEIKKNTFKKHLNVKKIYLFLNKKTLLKSTLYHNLKYELGDHNRDDELSVYLVL
jgi:hypothetical protein